MHVTLINPNIVTQKDDYFETGIPFMPITLAFLAGYLRSKKYELQVIDAFGADPFQVRKINGFFVQGLTIKQVMERIPQHTEAIILYANLVVAHEVVVAMAKALKQHFSQPLILIENSQSVNAFSLRHDADTLFDAGADILVTGEPEKRVDDLLQRLLSHEPLDNINGVMTRKNKASMAKLPKLEVNNSLDDLPFPAWDLFPTTNYWRLGYAHGPLGSRKYLSLLTSRGCPYGCRFCVVPETNRRRWRFRSPKNVVDEMEHWHKILGVREFHVQDLNPTIRKDRMVEISKEILKRNLDVRWKFVAGTKIETMDDDTITWMAKAGVNYISVSPESGSPRILKLMDKPFDHDYAVERIRTMHRLGVKSQACFVLGFPGETARDRAMTKAFAKRMAKAGVDEVALFIMTPVPGSYTWGMGMKGFKHLSELTFTPTWRKDFPELHRHRWDIYRAFFFTKLLHHPIKLLMQPINLLLGRFQTKTEMTLYRVLKVKLLHFFRGL